MVFIKQTYQELDYAEEGRNRQLRTWLLSHPFVTAVNQRELVLGIALYPPLESLGLGIGRMRRLLVSGEDSSRQGQ